jgi:hypothetical protein
VNKMIKVPIDNVIVITSNDGGYLGGRCVACGESGWVDNKYGYPFGTPRSNKLVHKMNCGLGSLLEIEVRIKS